MALKKRTRACIVT